MLFVYLQSERRQLFKASCEYQSASQEIYKSVIDQFEGIYFFPQNSGIQLFRAGPFVVFRYALLYPAISCSRSLSLSLSPSPSLFLRILFKENFDKRGIIIVETLTVPWSLPNRIQSAFIPTSIHFKSEKALSTSWIQWLSGQCRNCVLVNLLTKYLIKKTLFVKSNIDFMQNAW